MPGGARAFCAAEVVVAHHHSEVEVLPARHPELPQGVEPAPMVAASARWTVTGVSLLGGPPSVAARGVVCL